MIHDDDPSLCLLQILFLVILTETTLVIISGEGVRGTPCILDEIPPGECVQQSLFI